MNVGGAGNVTQLVRHLAARVGNCRPAFVAEHLDIDGRGQAEVQNLADDVGWLKEELDPRELPRQFFAQLLNVLVGWMVILGVQRNQDLSIRGADRAARCCKT